MVSSDLNDRDSSIESGPQQRSKTLLRCWVLLGISLAGLLGWLVLTNDPLGGEPVSVVKLINQTDKTAEVDAQNLGMRKTMRPEDPAKMTKNAGGADTTAEPDGVITIETLSAGAVALAPVPAKGLVEKTKLGLLPRIGKDGRRPSQIYARKLDADISGSSARVRIAIFVGGMGLSVKGTNRAIKDLPEQVTLGFAPYGKNLQSWIKKARDHGHEVLLQIPMEPYDFPDNDPGPYTLLTSLSVAENLERLKWLMTRFVGYAGVTNYMGAKFTATPESLRNILAEFSKRGLIYIDNGTSQRSKAKQLGRVVGLGVSTADLLIDANPSEAAIDNALSQLENIARRKGVAIGYASGLPISIKRITEWSKSLESRGIVLVPVTATIPAGQT
jgi:uncharacterized protein